MPYEIRMNMFLIKCSDINNLLCTKCEEIMNIILNKIVEHVFHELALNIQSNVKSIKDELTPKANDSKILVSFEKRLESVKNQEQQALKE